MIDLPMGWARARIDQITHINPRHPRTLNDRIPVTFVRMPALSETSWRFESTEERSLGEVRKGFTHFAEGDVLFAKITPCMENGKAAVALNLKNGIGCGTTELHVMRPLGGVDPKYLFYFIHQESFREEAARNFTGTAGQLRVPTSFIKEAEIPLSPPNEQLRIVAKLEKLLSRVNAAQERLATIPRILKRFRQSILAAACSGRLTADWREENGNVEPTWITIEALRKSTFNLRLRRGVPEQVPVSEAVERWDLPTTWGSYSAAELLRVGGFIDVKDGNHGAYHPKVSEFSVSGLPFITAAQVNNYRVDYEGAYKVSGKPLERLRVGFAKPGDVVYTHKGSVGRVAMIDRDCVLTPQTTYYRVSPKVFLNSFLMYYLSSHAFAEQVNVVKEQTTRDFVPISEQYLVFHRVPPLREQHEIVRRVEALFKIVDALEARYLKAKAHVDKLTQSILAKAFRGELVPQDPNDEPASVLLERIKAEPNGSAVVKRRSRK